MLRLGLKFFLFTQRTLRCGGFTLMELVITLVIGSILFTLAIPSFQTFILNNRITTQANELVADFAFARSEAMKRSENVLVCVKETATETCDSTTPEWRLNRVIWVDLNADGTMDAGEILRRRDTIEGDNVLLTSNIPTTLIFRRDGFVNVSKPATGLANHFKLCDRRQNPSARAIVLDPTGRVRTTSEAAFLTTSTNTNFLTCP